MYKTSIKFLPDELDDKLWDECDIIYKYARDLMDISEDKTLRLIMIEFLGIPCNSFKRLVKYLTFQEVLAFIYEGNLDKAYKKALEYKNNFKYMWNNHELDMVESGRLLAM